MKIIKHLILLTLILIAVISCKKEKTSNPVSDFPYYFSASINGSTIKFEANDINSSDGCGISRPSSYNEDYSTGEANYDIYEGTVFIRGIDHEHNTIRVHILKYFNHEPEPAERIAMINIGDYGYGVSNTSSSTINGASIDYKDENGKTWSTETGSQNGSVFTITELSENSNGNSQKIFKAIFSCKLYDETGEHSIQLKDGLVKGKILAPAF